MTKQNTPSVCWTNVPKCCQTSQQLMSLLSSWFPRYLQGNDFHWIESKIGDNHSFTWKLACHLKLTSNWTSSSSQTPRLISTSQLPISVSPRKAPTPLFFAIKFHINTSQLPNLLALSFVYLYSMWLRANAPASLKSYSCTKYTRETKPSETGYPFMFNLT